MGFVTTIFRHMLEAWPLCLPLRPVPPHRWRHTHRTNQRCCLYSPSFIKSVIEAQDNGHLTAHQTLSSLRALFYSSSDVFQNVVRLLEEILLERFVIRLILKCVCGFYACVLFWYLCCAMRVSLSVMWSAVRSAAIRVCVRPYRPTVWPETSWTSATAAQCARPARMSPAAVQGNWETRSVERVWSAMCPMGSDKRPPWGGEERPAYACVRALIPFAGVMGCPTGTSANSRESVTGRRNSSSRPSSSSREEPAGKVRLALKTNAAFLPLEFWSLKTFWHYLAFYGISITKLPAAFWVLLCQNIS